MRVWGSIVEDVRDAKSRKINRLATCGYGVRKYWEDKRFDHCDQCGNYPCSKINKLIRSQKGRKEYDYRLKNSF